MSTCACVFSKNGERLMPTIRLGKVRHLLKDGKAKIVKHHPFTIQLLYQQPVEYSAHRKSVRMFLQLHWHQREKSISRICICSI